MKKFGSSKHRKAASTLAGIYYDFFCCEEYGPLEQTNKLAARFCPERDDIRRGSIC